MLVDHFSIERYWKTAEDETIRQILEHGDDAELLCKEVLTTERTAFEAEGSEVTDGITYWTVLDVESERYDEIVALGEDDKHYQVLKRAETLFAIYYALDFLNLRDTERGGLLRAIGVAEGQNDLMSTMELGGIKDKIFHRGMRLLKKLFRDYEADEVVPYVC